MVLVDKCRDFNRNDFDLEEFAIFAVCVAGKTAEVQAQKVDIIAHMAQVLGTSPFQLLQKNVEVNNLEKLLRGLRMGQYKRITKALNILVWKDLRTITLEELEGIVGPKTARFFLMNTRPNQRLAALDTHILAELRECYPNTNIPKSTPPAGKTYRLYEVMWLHHCDKLGKDPAEYDLEVWTRRSNAKRQPVPTHQTR